MAIDTTAKYPTTTEIAEAANDHGYINGVVRVALETVIHNDERALKDLFSTRLVGDTLLTDIEYQLQPGATAAALTSLGEVLVFKVTGHVDYLLRERARNGQ